MVQVLDIPEVTAREEVVLHVLHKAFDLAFGLGPVRLAYFRSEAHIQGKSLELRVPDRLSVLPAEDDGLHVVRQDFFRDTAVVEEGVHHTAHE